MLGLVPRSKAMHSMMRQAHQPDLKKQAGAGTWTTPTSTLEGTIESPALLSKLASDAL
jgi:hypothetical protein